MAAGFAGENLQEYGIEGIVCRCRAEDGAFLYLRHRRQFDGFHLALKVETGVDLPAAAEGVRLTAQRIDIRLRRRPAGELRHHIWQYGLYLAQHGKHRIGMGDLALAHLVEHALERPCQLGDLAGAYHAAAALEGMESAPHFQEYIAVFRIVEPLRQHLVDHLQHFARVFDEDIHDLFIEAVIGRGVFGGGCDKFFRLRRRFGFRLRFPVAVLGRRHRGFHWDRYGVQLLPRQGGKDFH